MTSVKELRVSEDLVAAPMGKQPYLAFPTTRDVLRKYFRLVLRASASLAFISAITFVLTRAIPVNPTTAGFLYLVAVLLTATKGGLVESTISSVAAMLCFNYFSSKQQRTIL